MALRINTNEINRWFRRNGPRFLPYISSLGVIATAYVSSKCAIKANKESEAFYDEHSIKNFYSDKSITYEIDDRTLTDSEKKVEILKIYIKNYIPSILIGSVTIASIMATKSYNANIQQAIGSAYILANERYNDYRSKVIEHHGIEEDKKIREEIATDKYSHQLNYTVSTFDSTILDAHLLSMDDKKQLFYDEWSRRFFYSTIASVIEAEYHLNRKYCLCEWVYVNDWYSFLGIEQTVDGNEPGWCEGFLNDIFWIDFNHEVRHLDDGAEYIAIIMNWKPNDEKNYAYVCK